MQCTNDCSDPRLSIFIKKICKMYFVRALCTRTAEQSVKKIVFMLRQLTIKKTVKKIVFMLRQLTKK